MKIHLRTKDDQTIPCTLPYEGCTHVVLNGLCPACKEQGVKLQGGETTRSWDTYSAPARCLSCGKIAGELVVTVSTIFGLEEDEAVLHGQPRVY